MLVLISLASMGSDTPQKQKVIAEPTKALQITEIQQSPIVTAEPTEKPTYMLIGKDSNKFFDTISVLVDEKETKSESIAFEVRKTCTQKCTVDIYNNKKAFDLQNEYTALMKKAGTRPEDLTNWKKKNTIFIADHFLGSIDSASDSYQAFPFKDWYYKELKGIK